LGAIPVRNIELVIAHAASAVHIRYEPMRRLDGSFGFEPYSGGRFRITGNTVPALRAVAEGVNGASSVSAATMA
jgi:hypothetical protein